MGWTRITLTEDEQRIVREEQEAHPDPLVRRRMLAIWLLHCGTTRALAARIVGVSYATIERYVGNYRAHGLDGLRQPRQHCQRTSALVGYRALIRQSLEERPVRTVAEARQRIFELTGIVRGLSQTRKFLKSLGMNWQRVRAIPVPPKKQLAEHVADQNAFYEKELKPRLEAAQAGNGHVFFVDAAHFVFGTFLCCLWSFARVFIRAASGRQRFNVLGAWNAITRELITVTNTTVVNTATMCELLRRIAALGLTGPITLVLDNARYQRNAVVQALAASLGISLLYLPSYSPNLNLIERLWRFLKRRALYGHYHATFHDMRGAIEQTMAELPTRHADALASLMTLNFQRFENVSLLAA